jgi:CRISPR system Cascade subunit CasE
MTPLPPPSSALTMLRLLPDMAALGRWVAASGQRSLAPDRGYALHAALRATLGEMAPQPFALLERPGSVQLIGYRAAEPAALAEAAAMASTTDPLAAQALGLDRASGILIKPMPTEWLVGQRLSFEVRVAPVVRSRDAAVHGGRGGVYPEVDAAFHPAFAEPGEHDRQAAHGRWLAREMARGGAATVLTQRETQFTLSPMARRHQREEGRAARRSREGLLPDLTVRGELRIDNAAAFAHLLARGLGRHRSFGFGCLLLAPAGAWR